MKVERSTRMTEKINVELPDVNQFIADQVAKLFDLSTLSPTVRVKVEVKNNKANIEIIKEV